MDKNNQDFFDLDNNSMQIKVKKLKINKLKKIDMSIY